METLETPEKSAFTDEKVGFEPGELIACSKCGRNNAPNRLKCMYCAAELDLPRSLRENVRVRADRPETWETGFNVVCLRAGNIDVEQAARSVSVDAEFLRNVLCGPLPLPIARVRSETEGNLVVERLADRGIEAELIGDDDLRSPSRRLRSIELDEGEIAFVMFNSDEVWRVAVESIELIVRGVIVENEVRSTEIRKMRGSEFDDQIVTKSKTGVLDIYAGSAAFRVMEHGFDFSCLDGKKSWVAAENICALAELLRAGIKNAAFDESYENVRTLLEPIWEMTEVQEAGGVSRTGMGKLLVTRTTRQSNLDQFNKYSRMRRLR